MSFTVTGQLDDGREASVSWHEDGLARRDAPGNRRGLVGDALLIERALLDELDGRTFRTTVTGPFYLANLDDPVSSFVQLVSYFISGQYALGGDVPTMPPLSPSPEGAIP